MLSTDCIIQYLYCAFVVGCFPFPCTVLGFLLVFLHFSVLSLLLLHRFCFSTPFNHSIFVLLTFLLFFAEPCFSLVPHSFFSFSIVATEQWLAPKPLRVSPPPLVHSLPQVHHHRLRRARPPQRVRTPTRRLISITTRGCTSGLPSTCSLRPLRNSPTIISPTF